jgi:hypothetical protein
MQGKVMHVKRLKNGKSTTHPLYNGEVKAIKDWMAKRQAMSLDALTLGAGNTLFISERRTPLSRTDPHAHSLLHGTLRIESTRSAAR